VRFTLLLASTALAASLVLSACSGGSQALPGGAQSVAPMSHRGDLPALVNPQEDATTCPTSDGTTYLECYSIKPGKKFKDQWCIVYSSKNNGTCDTSILYPGTWTWMVSKVYQVSNMKPTKSITNSWKPNPGNPTENELKSSKTLKSTKGKVGYYIDLEACNSASECVEKSSSQPYLIGIIVK
jgi:hypothetical protein